MLHSFEIVELLVGEKKLVRALKFCRFGLALSIRWIDVQLFLHGQGKELLPLLLDRLHFIEENRIEHGIVVHQLTAKTDRSGFARREGENLRAGGDDGRDLLLLFLLHRFPFRTKE